MTKLNLFSPITQGAQAAEANEGSMELINCYVDKLSGLPVIKTRPGLQPEDDLGISARVDTFWWEAKQKLIIVCGSKVYYKTYAGGSLTDITPASSEGALEYNIKCMFTADEHGITMSTGLGLFWWNGSSATAVRINDEHAPSEITGLTYLKGYVIASEINSQSFAWATYAPTDSRTSPPPWSALRLSASSQPDNIIGLASGWEELFLLGRESAESQYVTGDSTVPFRSLQGSISEVGLVNKNVLAKLRNTWIFATPSREVVILDGRVPKVISKPISYKLQEMKAFEDVEAMVLFERFYILNFKSEDKTYVFDIEYNLWYRWELWDTRYKVYRKYIGATITNAKAWGKHVVGSYDGKLYIPEYTFLSDGIDYIRGQILSAHIDHGTLDRKFVSNIKLRLRRGY